MTPALLESNLSCLKTLIYIEVKSLVFLKDEIHTQKNVYVYSE